MKIVKRAGSFILVDRKTGYAVDGEFSSPRSAIGYASLLDEEVETKNLYRYSHLMKRNEYEAVMEGNINGLMNLYRI